MTDRPDAALLSTAGLKVTAPRRAVLEVLRSRPHATARQVHTAVAPVLPKASMQATYNVLKDLTAAGLTRCIEPAGHPARYELRVGDNHHHVVCRECGDIADVDCVVGQAPCIEPDHVNGYTIDQAEVTLWGRCPACAKEQQQGATA